MKKKIRGIKKKKKRSRGYQKSEMRCKFFRTHGPNTRNREESKRKRKEKYSVGVLERSVNPGAGMGENTPQMRNEEYGSKGEKKN